jgi:hypothetical protein
MEPPDNDGHHRPRLGTASRLAAVAIALALLGGLSAAFLLRLPHPAPRRLRTVASPTSPPIAPFAFTSVTVHPLPSAVGEPTTSASSVAVSVRASLGRFYQLSVSTPSAWTHGVPGQAWDAFAADVRDQARADAKALTLGGQVASIRSLTVDSATLEVDVLLDRQGHAQAATAQVSIQATGDTSTGPPVLVTINDAFILRRLDQSWLVTAWPRAKVSIGPVPTPPVGPSVGPSTAPSAGGSSAPAVGSPTPTPRVSP